LYIYFRYKKLFDVTEIKERKCWSFQNIIYEY